MSDFFPKIFPSSRQIDLFQSREISIGKKKIFELINLISLREISLLFGCFFCFHRIHLISHKHRCFPIIDSILDIFMHEEILQAHLISYLFSVSENRRLRRKRGLNSYEKLLGLFFINKQSGDWKFQITGKKTKCTYRTDLVQV